MVHLSRRTFVATVAVGTAALAMPGNAWANGGREMYGLIGKIRAVPGQREALIGILLDGASGLPGCLNYVIAQDPEDADAIWVTEVWDNQASHEASLSLPSVKDAISRGRPLIAGFEQRIETAPVAGHGFQVAA